MVAEKIWDAKPGMNMDEYKGMVLEMFNALDANKEGVLSVDQFKEFSKCLV